MIGRMLGPYQVLSKLGEGGMGEVYRATDTKLKRQVAIKVLPEAVAGDADRLARFRREAEVLAALNHPNIAAIYGFEKSGNTHALVMELVEGEDLSTLIGRRHPEAASVREQPREGDSAAGRRGWGPAATEQSRHDTQSPRSRAAEQPSRLSQGLPVSEALPIAKQIAEALEAAHEQGIIHRDLKPANVKVRDDGTVKVLDFGLAKAIEPAVASGSTSATSASMSPTITTPAMTAMGMILGTAAYMAPEQARGRPVDKRADIWAFGCVLYEMLTGKRAFEGEDISITLANVMKDDVAWAALPPDLPPTVERLLRRCLDKDPRKRLRDIGEARLMLEDTGAFEPAGAIVSVPAPTTWAWRSPLAWLVAGALVAAGAIIGAALPRDESVARDPVWLSLLQPPGIEISNVQFAISPDGRHVAFVGIPRDAPRALWVTNLHERGASATRRLAGTELATNPFWSPDSQSVGFFTPESLKWVRLDGGEPFTVAPMPDRLGPGAPDSGTWNDDGVILFSSSVEGGLSRVAARGGDVVLVTNVDRAAGEVAHLHPRFLPDGEHFLYLVYSGGDGVLVVGQLGSSDRETLFSTHYGVEWAASGHLLALDQGGLVAYPFDLASRRVTGPPASLGVTVRFNESNQKAAFSVSRDGVFVIREGGAAGSADSPLMRLGPRTPAEPLTRTVERLADGRVSPDGTRVVAQTGERGAGALVLFFLAGRPDLPLGVMGRSPVWLDDDRIAFSDLASGEIMVIAADGRAVEPRRLFDTPIVGLPLSVSRDGQLLVERQGEDTGSDLWLVPLDGSAEPRPWLETRYRESGGRFSPDGRSIAYRSNRAGVDDIWIGPYGRPGAPQRVIVGADRPVWSAAGDALYAAELTRSVRVGIDSTGEPDGEAAPISWLDGFVLFDAHPDGRFVGSVENRASQEAGRTDLRVALNWFEELKRLAPTGN